MQLKKEQGSSQGSLLFLSASSGYSKWVFIYHSEPRTLGSRGVYCQFIQAYNASPGHTISASLHEHASA